MTNEVRKLTDDEIKMIFRQTRKTAEMKIHDIEYYHMEYTYDYYIVTMIDGQKYFFQQTTKQNHKRFFSSPINYNVYNRIVKLKKN